VQHDVRIDLIRRMRQLLNRAATEEFIILPRSKT
jgi:hypothetical protein